MNNYDAFKKESETILTTHDLSISIKRLERKRVSMEDDLKDHFHNLLEGLKPATLIKNTLHEVQQSAPLRNDLLKIALGLGAGYFSRKLIVGKSAGLLKKALGAALQFGVTRLVAEKSDGRDENDSGSGLKKKNFLRRILSI